MSGARRKENRFCWPKMKNEWNKWKNHFYEMKGDVGMSLHEKEREQEDAYTKSLITPSLHHCFFQDHNIHSHAGNWMSRCCAVCLPNAFITNKQTICQNKQRCRDGVMSDFVSWCRHLLVPFFFHEVTSLHPPS